VVTHRCFPTTRSPRVRRPGRAGGGGDQTGRSETCATWWSFSATVRRLLKFRFAEEGTEILVFRRKEMAKATEEILEDAASRRRGAGRRTCSRCGKKGRPDREGRVKLTAPSPFSHPCAFSHSAHRSGHFDKAARSDASRTRARRGVDVQFRRDAAFWSARPSSRCSPLSPHRRGRGTKKRRRRLLADADLGDSSCLSPRTR